MSFLQLLFCCLTIGNVAKGRIVQGIIGRNVSFTWTFSNIRNDSVLIIRGNSLLFDKMPYNNNFVPRKTSDRVRVSADNATTETVTVIVTILNITQNDAGLYSVLRNFDFKELDKSVRLQAIDETMIPKIAKVNENRLDLKLILECRLLNSTTGRFLWKLNGSLIERNNSRYYHNDTVLLIKNLTTEDQYNTFKCMGSESDLESDPYPIKAWVNYYMTMTTTQKKDTEEASYYTTTYISEKGDTKGIDDYTVITLTQNEYMEGRNPHTTASMTPKVDAEGFPTKRDLQYIVLGMGAVFAVVLLACVLHRIWICLRADRLSNRTTFTDSNKDDRDESLYEECQSGNYWTIINNERGEMSSSIEKKWEQSSALPLIGQTVAHITNTPNHFFRPDNNEMNKEIDGYLNPIGETIPPIIKAPRQLLRPDIGMTKDFDGYLNPIEETMASASNEPRRLLRPDIEMIKEIDGYLSLIGETIPPTTNESRRSLRPDIEMMNESDGYLNPAGETIASTMNKSRLILLPDDIEMKEELNPIGKINTPTSTESMQLFEPKSVEMSKEQTWYLNPVHSCPVEFDDYIHPLHIDPVNADSVFTHQSTKF